mgnify:FL=1
MIRITSETKITVEDCTDMTIDCKDKIFEHMINTLFFYMNKKVSFQACYDLRHHLWEDGGITTGMYLKELIKDKNYARYGTSIIPMDDALVLCCVDISRAYCEIDIKIKDTEEGFESSLLTEFVGGLCRSLSVTVHLKQLSGYSGHHIIEACFKSLGLSLQQAIKDCSTVFSTKGVL